MALLGAAAAKAMGLKVSETNCSVTTAHRQRTKQRQKLAEEIRNAWTAPDAGVLHWDGKTLKMRRGKAANFLAIYISGVKDAEPSHLLGIRECPGGSGKQEYEVVKQTLEMRGVSAQQVVAMVFDTTLSNTGVWEGVCSYLGKYFGVPILWCGCRKHICELRIKWFIITRTGPTKDPGRKLFRRFLGGFLAMEKELKKEDLVRMDLATKPEWMKELAKELLTWAMEIYRLDIFPRNDYKEFLGWAIFHLGGEVDGFWPLKLPGPDHQARWMADCIYYPKMLACSKAFPMSCEELEQCQDITEYIVFFHTKPWFQCTLASEAACSDLIYICQIHRRYKLSQIWKVCEAFYRQLWYLTGEMIPLALLSHSLPVSELEALARALHKCSRADPKIGKPVFPTITIFLMPYPTPPSLFSFVTEDSWAIMDRLGLGGPNDWLLLPQHLWPLFPPYLKLQEFAQNLSVSNCIAERGCHLITEFVNRVDSPEAREALCDCVAYHREMVKDFSKKSLENC